jgi:hypothetical protein
VEVFVSLHFRRQQAREFEKRDKLMSGGREVERVQDIAAYIAPRFSFQ